MWLSVGFEDQDEGPASPDSTALDLSVTMAAEAPPPDGQAVLTSTPKTDPDQTVDPDPERSADREAVALAMVTDLTKATGIPPFKRDEMTDMMELGAPQRKRQRKRPRENEKTCIVCGDKALAHNFDAITCESCKAFFRRNALRPERMTCLFKGDCHISIQTRRFCPACRLKKCFTMGMKADLILDDTERKARMDKVAENRTKRMAKDGNNSSDSQVGSSSGHPLTMVSPSDFTAMNGDTTSMPSTLLSTSGPARSYQEEAASALQQLTQKQQQQKPAESSQSRMTTLHAVLAAASGFPTATIAPVLNIPTTGYSPKVPSLSTSLFSPTHTQASQQPPPRPPTTQNTTTNGATTTPPPVRSDFQHVPRDLLPSDPHMYWRLSEEEKTLLTQLSSAYQATIMTLPERVPCEGGGLFHTKQGDPASTRSIESIFETSEKNMQQLINFVQRLGDFHMLREDDKIAVLQASCMRSVILRWTALYVVERNTWLTRFGECGVGTASVIFGHEDIVQEMAAFCRCMKTILKNDVTLFVLTHCLILFDPREQNLVDRQLINTFRDKYVILLKHYLESEYSFLYTERYQQAIMDKIVEIRQVAIKCMGVMKEFREYIPPLTKQLLNLEVS